MAQKKEHHKKLLDFIGMIVKDPENNDFKNGLQKLLGIDSTSTMPVLVDVANDKIEHIYEYCIEEVVRKQAEEFYADFPLPQLIPDLVKDYARMESFRRKDNFWDFCLALYQQIECITNALCENKKLNDIAEKMWGYPAFVASGKDIIPTISKRVENSEFTIAKLVFGAKNMVERSKQSIQTLYANDKVKTITYFVGFQAMMKNSDYDNYIKFTDLIFDVYVCRNKNHRGNTPQPWESDIINRIEPLKSFYYFSFIGMLAQYISYIKEGWAAIDKIYNYTQTIEKKSIVVDGPNIIGKIDLAQLEKYNKKKK